MLRIIKHNLKRGVKIMANVQPVVINPPVLSPIKASQHLGIDTNKDALKASRSTGILWGVKAPQFIKAGSKKILYRVDVLDEWLSQFQSYSINAEIH